MLEINVCNLMFYVKCNIRLHFVHAIFAMNVIYKIKIYE